MNSFDHIMLFAIGILCLAILITMFRFVKGPSVVDRIASLDLMAASLIGIIVIYTMISQQIIFMDVALILSLVAFLGTMSFAYYLIHKTPNE